METIFLDQDSIGTRVFPDVRPILLIGNFDGVHLGHVSLIDKAKELAKKQDTSLAIMSFSPHPRYFFNPDCDRFSIVSDQHKRILIEKQGISYLYNICFDEYVANTTAEEFIRVFLYKTIFPSCVIVGENFRFGKSREGDISFLKSHAPKYSIDVDTADLFSCGNNEVSSSIIRKELRAGDIDKANKLLGWTWHMQLKVNSVNSCNDNECIIDVSPADKNIISIDNGRYESTAVLSSGKRAKVFSLHDGTTSIKILLSKDLFIDDLFNDGCFDLYPEQRINL